MDNSEKKVFNIDEMFKPFHGGFHFNSLFDVLIHDNSIILSLGYTDLKIKYYSKNGFTATQLIYLFTRQYEHEMVAYDNLPDGDIVIDERDMEGKWRTFETPAERNNCCGRMLSGFEYDPVTKIVAVMDQS